MGMFASFLLLPVYLAYLVEAIPLTLHSNTGTATSGENVFQSEPSGRGTWGILFSCSSTFFFCVWTAVHPNIIGPSERTKNRVFYKIVLMIAAMLLPEGLLIFALGQYLRARELSKRVIRVKRSNLGEDDGTTEESNEVTVKIGMEEAYFVVMGGYVVESHPTPAQSFSAGNTTAPTPARSRNPPADNHRNSYYTLTPRGFADHLIKGHIKLQTGADDNTKELFDKRTINDKSKTSNIAKALALIQAVWLLVQCLARGVAGLPLTLLEIHVAIQVGIAVLIYSLWWYKPLDVNEPIILSLHIETGNRPYYKLSLCTDHLGSMLARGTHDIISELDRREYQEDDEPSDKPNNSLLFMFFEGAFIVLTGGLHAAAWNVHFPTPIEALLWRISSIGMVAIPLFAVLSVGMNHYERHFIQAAREGQYGEGLTHLFQLTAKRMLDGAKARTSQRKRNQKISTWAHFLAMCAFHFMEALYVACISFILIEAYISLRNPPDRAFETPRWNDFWPHLL